MASRNGPLGADFKLRPARRGDQAALSALLAELGYLQGLDSTTLSWVIGHPEMEIHVAADRLDRPTGLIAFSHRPQLRLRGRIVTIDELVVAQAWRRKGVGSALLATAIARAKALKCCRVELAAPRRSPEVIAFCKRSGFVEVDEVVMRYAELEEDRS